ncbi:hypothetical protein [Neisseria meningitidis]|uniref:hypothetical protein n=1 Tax=Neisseria meningitidis TaxID=487 RepID=UPI0013DEE448|nr:hypothetical protein [Neisseria meningitidis]
MQKCRTKTRIPSFPQKQKIKNRNPVIPAQAGIQSCRCGNLSGKTVSLDFTFWIPTFVGMTGFWFPCGWIRHSRAGGNPELSVQKLIGKNGFFRFYVLDSHFRGNDGILVSVRMDSSFPRRRESRVVGAETYWIKRFL